jgi:hypothetical protein
VTAKPTTLRDYTRMRIDLTQERTRYCYVPNMIPGLLQTAE